MPWSVRSWRVVRKPRFPRPPVLIRGSSPGSSNSCAGGRVRDGGRHQDPSHPARQARAANRSGDGFGSSTYTWRRNLDALAERYRLFGLDLKGFGLTAKPRDGHYHVSAFTDHLLGYLDAMKIGRPVLVGSSMGGTVATRLVLLHPDRVAGLVLVDPAPIHLPGEKTGRGVRPAPTEAAEHSEAGSLAGRLLPLVARTMITRQAVEGWMKAGYHDPSLVTAEARRDLLPADHDRRGDRGPCRHVETAHGTRTAVPPLRTLTVPTLVIWGKHDRIVPGAVAGEYTLRDQGKPPVDLRVVRPPAPRRRARAVP